MESGFATVVRRGGRVVEVRSRGTLTLPQASELEGRLRVACEEVAGPALVVGDVRQTRVAGDATFPHLLHVLESLGPSILRAGILVEPTNGLTGSTSFSPSDRTFQRAADLLFFLGEVATPDERDLIWEFLDDWNRPLARGAPAAPSISRATVAQAAESVLLVEDNPDDVALTLGTFRRSKLVNDIIVASDGAQALDWLFGTGAREGHPPLSPRLVLLDLHLPKVEGLEVLRRIRAHERTHLLPVVILTSSSDQRDLVEGYRLGINSYVRKPIEVGDFIDAVQQLNIYWLLTGQPLRPGYTGNSPGTDLRFPN